MDRVERLLLLLERGERRVAGAELVGGELIVRGRDAGITASRSGYFAMTPRTGCACHACEVEIITESESEMSDMGSPG